MGSPEPRQAFFLSEQVAAAVEDGFTEEVVAGVDGLTLLLAEGWGQVGATPKLDLLPVWQLFNCALQKARLGSPVLRHALSMAVQLVPYLKPDATVASQKAR